uniref:Uncharacterized protein n=1 Tax=Panagrolaimus sp. PS1159 TaxID=55785 RepID=A0AC35GBN7_9BILA
MDSEAPDFVLEECGEGFVAAEAPDFVLEECEEGFVAADDGRSWTIVVVEKEGDGEVDVDFEPCLPPVDPAMYFEEEEDEELLRINSSSEINVGESFDGGV